MAAPPVGNEADLSRREWLAALGAAFVAACGSSGVAAPADGGGDGGSADAGTGSDGGLRADGGAVDAGAPDAGTAPTDGGIGTHWDPASTPLGGARFALGVQAGDVTNVSAILWTRYGGAAPLRLRVVEDPNGLGTGALRVVNEIATEVREGGYVKVEVGGLRPATQYRYAFLELGGDNERSLLGRFVTAPFANDATKVRFGATSCTQQSYAPFPTLTRAAHEKLDFFLLLGDTTYNDGARTRDEYRRKWAENLSSRGYLDLLPSTSHIATWDDHEADDNFDGETIDPGLLSTAREVFFETMAMARPAEPNQNRIWRRYRWGKAVEVFMLDSRAERRPSTRQTTHAEYLSPAQLAWLKDGLLTSTAAFKIIGNSVPIANFPALFDTLANDRWEGYASQRNDLLDFITSNDIPGVVFLSGDFHVAAVVHLERSGPRARYLEILAGPGGQAGNPAVVVLTGSEFELATTTNNVVIFDADATVSPPTLRFRFVDGNGGVFFEKILNP